MIRMVTHIYAALDRTGAWLFPSLARLTFAAVLLRYFWNSGLSKFDGVFTPSVGAFAQIYPRAIEAAGYDASLMGWVPYLVVLFGGWAEITLPLLILLGLLTRPAAAGMIGFIVVQSLTDVWGHGVDAATLGAWFDRTSDALILDQRAMWGVVLAIMVFQGPGPLSVDRLLRR